MAGEHPSDATVAAFLDGALDEPARAVVVAHVDTCPDCRLLLADAVVAATGKVEHHAEIGPGTLIGGRYRIEKQLGQGGFGAVYLAKDEKLGRAVAVKVLVGANDENARLRFEREARVLAELEHPHVVRVLDFGDEKALLPYLVLERLEGETLATRIRREGALPLPLAIRLALEVLSALAAAHAHGIIHRDLKPANVFLVTKGDAPSVRVLDFGIAKLLQGGDRLRTETGSMLGTPAYMAPEQLLASPAVDARSDVHAVGLLLFEMLTGKRPFIGDRIALVTAILVEDRPRVDAVRSDIPIPVADVIAKALARNAEARFPDAASMARALEGAMQAAPPKAPFGPRRIFATGLLSAMAVGLLGGAVLVYWVTTRPRVLADQLDLDVPPSASTLPIDTSAPPPVSPLPSQEVESGAARANCLCYYYLQGKVWGNPLCPTPQSPKCECNSADAIPLCEFVRSSEETTCKAGYKTYTGASLKTGDPCKGYKFVWKHGQDKPGEAVETAGKLSCDVCWKPAYQTGTHRAPCRALDSKGQLIDGIFLCH